MKNVLIPDENGVTFMSKKFVVKDATGKIIFKSEAEEANISAKKLNIQSKQRVVSIGLFCFHFVSFSYNGVYFLQLFFNPMNTTQGL